jgi:hypothetical protein
MDINPRFVHFARVHGRAPEEQLALDRVEYDDGGLDAANMLGFTLWIGSQWAAWWQSHRATLPQSQSYENYVKTDADHAAFDAQLAALGPCAGCDECLNA